MSEHEQLKPCPFCGSEADYSATLRGYWAIACNVCSAEQESTTQEGAIEAWNRRVNEN